MYKKIVNFSLLKSCLLELVICEPSIKNYICFKKPNNLMKYIFLLLSLMLFSVPVIAQGNTEYRVISTAVPFLAIASDARAGGMGAVGVATPTAVFSQQWNPAKYALDGRRT